MRLYRQRLRVLAAAVLAVTADSTLCLRPALAQSELRPGQLRIGQSAVGKTGMGPAGIGQDSVAASGLAPAASGRTGIVQSGVDQTRVGRADADQEQSAPQAVPSEASKKASKHGGTFTLGAQRYRFTSDRYTRFNGGFQPISIQYSTPPLRVPRQMMDLSIEFGAPQMESLGSLDVMYVDDGMIAGGDTVPQFTRQMAYFSLAVRFLPIGWKAVTPYVGVGPGYYWYYTVRGFAGGEVACPTGGGQCYEYETNRRTLARGFGGDARVGVYLPLTPRMVLASGRTLRLLGQVEMKYHRARIGEDGSMDLGGTEVLINLGLSWGRVTQAWDSSGAR